MFTAFEYDFDNQARSLWVSDVKAWPNEDTSKGKVLTCVSVWPELASPETK